MENERNTVETTGNRKKISTFLGMTRPFRFTVSVVSLIIFAVLSFSLIETAQESSDDSSLSIIGTCLDVPLAMFRNIFKTTSEYQDGFVTDGALTDRVAFEKRLNAIRFFFGGLALVLWTGVQADVTIQSFQDRDGIRTRVHNTLRTIAFLAVDIAAYKYYTNRNDAEQ